MLELQEVSIHYGKVEAVKGISFSVEMGEIVTLIGPNGAGKSSTFRAICGLKGISGGDILFEGQSIKSLRPEAINKLGIAHVPEGRRVFARMTVRENLEMGAYLRTDTGAVKRDLDDVFERFPRLRERLTQAAGTLSGGEQQMLAIGRALMSAPKLILMDEPSLGLAPIMCAEIAKIIRNIHDGGRTVVLVEQNAMLALKLADRAYVLETGNIVMEGNADDLYHNDEIMEAFLGGAAA